MRERVPDEMSDGAKDDGDCRTRDQFERDRVGVREPRVPAVGEQRDRGLLENGNVEQPHQHSDRQREREQAREAVRDRSTQLV